MNILKISATVLAICAVSTGANFGFSDVAKADDYESFSLAPGFEPQPAVGTGLSGGTRSTSDCGFVDVADAPDHIITLTQPFSFLRATVEAEDDVTLLIAGPDGTVCSDDVNGLLPEIAGSWSPGTYSVWVGDFVGDRAGTYRYQITFSEQ